MRLTITALAGLFLSATLLGCGGTSIPAPPSSATNGPPPGTSPDMTAKIGKGSGGGMGAARPPGK